MSRSGLFFADFLPNILIFNGAIVKKFSIAGTLPRFDAFCRPGAWAESRIIERSAEWQVQINHAVAVGQQVNRQRNRKTGRRSCHLVAKTELFEYQPDSGGQPGVEQNHIVDVNTTELAAFNAVSRILDRMQ